MSFTNPQALILLLSPMACSSSTGPDGRVEQARELWDSGGLTTYEYEFTMSCFCPPVAIEPVRVSVVNDVVVGAVRVRDGHVAHVEPSGLLGEPFGTGRSRKPHHLDRCLLLAMKVVDHI